MNWDQHQTYKERIREILESALFLFIFEDGEKG
jgi:hypothetical protein